MTIALKFGAYFVTDSIGLLSDAVESLVNLIAAGTALFALWYSTRPVDRSHNYGHQKIEFFSAAIEGALIMVVEDIHWADDATLDLLRFLGRRVAETHGLVIVP